MKILLVIAAVVYLSALVYIYVTQDDKIFNATSIEKREPFSLKGVEQITFEIDDIVLDGIYKKSQKEDAPLILYFGGNADDATRILLHVKSLVGYDIVAFNYRGFASSTGKPSEKAMFGDALKIYDKYKKEKEVMVIGRSLGTGVATYVASKRDVKGLILITPFDSIVSMAKEKYPYFPIDLLLKHKFESAKYMLDVQASVGLIEVEFDDVISKKHFDKLMAKVKNLALHVELKNTTHADVLMHPDFEKTLKRIIDVM